MPKVVPMVRYAEVLGERRWRLYEVLRFVLDVRAVAMAYYEGVA